MYNFLRNCYRLGKVTAEQVWEAADSGKITEEQAQKICGPRRSTGKVCQGE